MAHYTRMENERIEEIMDLTHIYNQDDPEFEPLKNIKKLDKNNKNLNNY